MEKMNSEGKNKVTAFDEQVSDLLELNEDHERRNEDLKGKIEELNYYAKVREIQKQSLET